MKRLKESQGRWNKLPMGVWLVCGRVRLQSRTDWKNKEKKLRQNWNQGFFYFSLSPLALGSSGFQELLHQAPVHTAYTAKDKNSGISVLHIFYIQALLCEILDIYPSLKWFYKNLQNSSRKKSLLLSSLMHMVFCVHMSFTDFILFICHTSTSA